VFFKLWPNYLFGLCKDLLISLEGIYKNKFMKNMNN